MGRPGERGGREASVKVVSALAQGDELELESSEARLAGG